MTRIRKLGALALATVLAAAVVLVGAPSPAMAASISVSISGSRVTVTATADDAALDNHLIVVNPAGDQTTLDSYSAWSKRPLSGSFTAETNGSYTAKVEKKILGIWWGVTSRTFTVRAAPAAPSGLSATASGSKINVSWNVGNEIDLSGYRVNAGGASKSGSVGTFCSGTNCTTTLTPSATGAVTVTVTAMRAGGTSAASTTSVTIGGSSGGSGGGQIPSLPNGGGGTTPLSPASPDSPYSLPNVAPEGSNPNFAYPTPPPQVANTIATKNRSAAAADSPSLQWGKSIAIALILLLCAAHLGTWTRRLRLAQGSGPRATRLGRARVSVAQARIAQAEALAKAGVLSKEAILGSEGNEGKTKKGLLRRKKAGQEQLALVNGRSTVEVGGEEGELVDIAGVDGLATSEDHELALAPEDVGETVTDVAVPEVGHLADDSFNGQSGSVEEALAALTRGSETRVDLQEVGPTAAAEGGDSGMGIFAPASSPLDRHDAPESESDWPQATPDDHDGRRNEDLDRPEIYVPQPALAPESERKDGRRGAFGRGGKGRRRAK